MSSFHPADGSVIFDHLQPARRQFRRTRSATPHVIVVHTPESNGSARAVAKFIGSRTDTAGSYHSLVDGAEVVHLGHYEWTMFHVRNYNARSLGLSFCGYAADWDRRRRSRPDVVAAQMRNGAAEAARMARWLQQAHGVTVDPTLLTKAQVDKGRAGFVTHADLDPGRRSDPGRAFPWVQFLNYFAEAMQGDPVPDNPYESETNDALRLLAEHAGYNGAIDGWFGPAALRALHHLKIEWQSRGDGLVALRRETNRASKLLHETMAERDALRAELAETRRFPAHARSVADAARALIAAIDLLDSGTDDGG